MLVRGVKDINRFWQIYDRVGFKVFFGRGLAEKGMVISCREERFILSLNNFFNKKS